MAEYRPDVSRSKAPGQVIHVMYLFPLQKKEEKAKHRVP
jgi:hypothetical protein